MTIDKSKMICLENDIFQIDCITTKSSLNIIYEIKVNLNINFDVASELKQLYETEHNLMI